MNPIDPITSKIYTPDTVECAWHRNYVYTQAREAFAMRQVEDITVRSRRPANMAKAMRILDEGVGYKPLKYTGQGLVNGVTLGISKRVTDKIDGSNLRKYYEKAKSMDQASQPATTKIPHLTAINDKEPLVLTKAERLLIGDTDILAANFREILLKKIRGEEVLSKRQRKIVKDLIRIRTYQQPKMADYYQAHKYLEWLKTNTQLRDNILLTTKSGRLTLNNAQNIFRGMGDIIDYLEIHYPVVNQWVNSFGCAEGMRAAVTTTTTTASAASLLPGVGSLVNAGIGVSISLAQACEEMDNAREARARYDAVHPYAQRYADTITIMGLQNTSPWVRATPDKLKELGAIALCIMGSQKYIDSQVNAALNIQSATVNSVTSLATFSVAGMIAAGVITTSALTVVGLPIALMALTLLSISSGAGVNAYRFLRDQYAQRKTNNWFELDNWVKTIIKENKNIERILQGESVINDCEIYLLDLVNEEEAIKRSEHYRHLLVSAHELYTGLSEDSYGKIALAQAKVSLCTEKINSSDQYRQILDEIGYEYPALDLQSIAVEERQKCILHQIFLHQLSTDMPLAMKTLRQRLCEEQVLYRDRTLNSLRIEKPFTRLLIDFGMTENVIGAVINSIDPAVAEELLAKILMRMG